MRPKLMLFGALLCLLIVHHASAQCLCAEAGQDYCGCKGAIRPAPKLIERIKTAKFPPIGDTCWCGQQLVEPAIPPKPPCKVEKKCDCKCNCGAPPPPPPLPPCLAPAPMKKLPIGIPADAISISLALRAGKAFAVPEAKLSYGPTQLPLNGVKKIYMSQIPEEKLYALNAGIIEFKRRPIVPKVEEIVEEEEEEEEDVPLPRPHLTYEELGYVPAKLKIPLFMRCGYAAPPPAVVEKEKITGCGFKPGKIALNTKFMEEPYLGGCL